jgi:uncharacterized repeat protein (TIGR03803 family)
MTLRKCAENLIFTFLILVAISLVANPAHASPKFRTLYNFTGGSDGRLPVGVPAVDNDGNLYGTTCIDCSNPGGTIFELAAPKTRGGSWTESTLYTFPSNGIGYPTSITIDKDGTLYGAGGGQNTRGFIFRLTPPRDRGGSWTYNLLYELQSGSNGSAIQGDLVLDAEGNLYGATEEGGDLSCDNGYGCGTVFQLERPTKKNGKWNYKVLYAFIGQPDGMQPFAGVTFDQEGNLWGTTSEGGSNGWGTVYRMKPPKKKGQQWTEKVIYSFNEYNDDIISPEGPVAFDSSGNLYGTTPLGGDPNCQAGLGCGVVFELSTPTWTYQTLYEFQGGDDGINPQGYIVFDSKGNLYSTTTEGGGGKGDSDVAFELTPSSIGGAWTETVLHRFIGAPGPNSGLTWGKWGELYGATWLGGKYDDGSVFELQP